MKKWVIILLVLTMASCAYVVKDPTSPLAQSKAAYLEMRTQFNNTMETILAILKTDPSLKPDFDKYVIPARRTLDAWKTAIDLTDLSKATESEQAFRTARTQLMAFLYDQLTKGEKK
jgi:hypothetical protein